MRGPQREEHGDRNDEILQLVIAAAAEIVDDAHAHDHERAAKCKHPAEKQDETLMVSADSHRPRYRET